MASNLLSALLSQIGQGATGVANTLSSFMQPQQSQSSMWGKPSNETIRVDEQGRRTRDFGKMDFGNLSGQAPAPSMSPTPMPTPMPSPMLSQPSPQAPLPNDNFKFAFDTLVKDQGWSQHGPRPNFMPKQPPKEIADIIRRVFPNEATVAAAVAGSENGRYEPGPSADNVWNEDGSIDRGIFAINSNTFNGLMSRQGDKLKKLGIKSFEDMYDPEKNAIVAKMIREGARDWSPERNPEGWGGWFGWQDVGFDLNKGYYTKADRVNYELKKNKK